MSRAETFMLIALGFALGTLIALLFGRLVWHAAVRVGSRRMQRQMPSTLVEMQAERDRLRAECAMLSRKLEIRSDELKSQLVEQTAELTRERNRAEGLLQDVTEREALLAEREQRAGASHEQTHHLETELAARTNALHELQARFEESQDSNARMKQELSQLTHALADRDSRIGDLRQELSQQPLRIESALRKEQLNTADRLEQRIDELTALSREIAEQRYNFNRERHELAALAAASVESPHDPADHSDDGYDRSSSFEEVTNQERSIDRMLSAAERETLALAAEVERLEPLRAEYPQLSVPDDDLRPAGGRLVEPREPELPPFGRPVAANEKPQRGLANVVSLAARIRALQKNITG